MRGACCWSGTPCVLYRRRAPNGVSGLGGAVRLYPRLQGAVVLWVHRIWLVPHQRRYVYTGSDPPPLRGDAAPSIGTSLERRRSWGGAVYEDLIHMFGLLSHAGGMRRRTKTPPLGGSVDTVLVLRQYASRTCATYGIGRRGSHTGLETECGRRPSHRRMPGHHPIMTERNRGSDGTQVRSKRWQAPAQRPERQAGRSASCDTVRLSRSIYISMQV